MKFLKKGIKTENKYYPVNYSKDGRIDNIKGLTIYAKDIMKGLPKEINPENNSDSRSDYFEKDKIFIPLNSLNKELTIIYNSKTI